MRTVFLYCLGMLLIAATGRAQNPSPTFGGFYGRLDAGYFAPHAGNYYGANGFVSWPISGMGSRNITTGVESIDYKRSSYSSGLALNLGAGYMFNKNIGVDLGVSLGLAPKKYSYEYTQTLPTGTVMETWNTRSQMPILLMPSVVLSTGASDPFSVYSRMGLVFPFGGNLLEEYMYANDILDIDELTDEEYDFFMSKGLIGSVGVNYRLGPLSIYGEVRGMSLTRYVKSSEVTRYSYNGMDELAQLDVRDRQTEYFSNYTYDPTTQTVTVPSRQPVVSLPYSNFGVQVGASYNFGTNDPNDTTGAGLLSDRLFFRAGLGYNQPHAGNYYRGEGLGSLPIRGTETYTTTTNTTTIDYKRASYGSGLNVNIAGGYMFSRHFGAELGVNIGVAPQTNTYEYEVIDTISPVTNMFETRANLPVYINPSFVFAAGDPSSIQIYSRAGVVLPIGGSLTQTYTRTAGTNITIEETKFKYGMSKGLSGALGVQFPVNDMIGIWGEVNGMSLTRYTKSSEVIGLSVNGVDQLGSLTTSQKQTEYHTNITVDPQATSTANPSAAPVISMPYSNWGIAFGTYLRF